MTPVFSLDEWLGRLSPISLPQDAAATVDGDTALDTLALAVNRLAKQQFRMANQVEQSVSDAHELSQAVREQAEEHRRERIRQNERARRTALQTVEIIDALDDVSRLVKQRGDAQWIAYMNRLTERTLEIFAAIEITEVRSTDVPFDPEVHQSLDTISAPPGSAAYMVVDVVQRGFRYKGDLLRPAQVITTRP